MALNWLMIAGSVLAIVLVIGALFALYDRMLPAAPARTTLLLSLGCAAAGVVAWLVFALIFRPPVMPELLLPIAALGGLAAFLATLVVRASGASPLASILFSACWSLVVFAPVAVLSFTGLGPWGIRPVDHGGSMPVNVAAGASALGVLLATRSKAPLAARVALPRNSGVIAVATLTVAWLGWLVGAELAIDELTPGILINGVAAGVGGVAGWIIVQRILHQSTSVLSAAAGLVSGLVAVTAGAPLYGPISAAVVGVVAGVAAGLFTLRRVAKTARGHWFIVGSHLLAGSVGLVMLALIGNDLGFLFTGQYVLLRDQVICAVLTAAYSAGVSWLLWRAASRVRPQS